MASIDGLFISAEENLTMPQGNTQPSAAQSDKEEHVVVLLRDIEFLEWDLVALENQVNEMRTCGRIIQTDKCRVFTIGEDAHRCFEQSFKTKNVLQKKREQLEELLNNQ